VILQITGVGPGATTMVQPQLADVQVDFSSWHVLPVPGIAAFRQLLEVHLLYLRGRRTGKS
jgi:hypothetical protein